SLGLRPGCGPGRCLQCHDLCKIGGAARTEAQRHFLHAARAPAGGLKACSSQAFSIVSSKIGSAIFLLCRALTRPSAPLSAPPKTMLLVLFAICWTGEHCRAWAPPCGRTRPARARSQRCQSLRTTYPALQES